MSILHIQLFGDFRVVHGEMPITTINTPRLQALLTYLLLHRDAPQARRHLAFLFWPDTNEAQARTNLRHQFHLLRQAFPTLETFLLTDAQTVQWRPDLTCQFDVADFEMATAPDVSLTTCRRRSISMAVTYCPVVTMIGSCPCVSACGNSLLKR